MWVNRSNTFRYAILGVLFGFIFPILSTLGDLIMHQLPLTLEGLFQIQQSTPLHWVIDTAPLFLGLAASLAGRRQDRLTLVNEDLKQQIRERSRALHQLENLGTTLEQRVVDRTRKLQAAADVSHATTSVLDPYQLLRRVVNLVRDRFDLYYVGLFLVDESGQFAVLRAGTGEAGRQMLAAGHRLEVGGDSMIGQCVTKAEGRIALDVGEEAVWFDNPHLPYTRSEMALPLRSRARVIGAMTVQDTQEAAFDETDIAVMQTMADQVAVAIDNAQLFAQTQAALKEMEATHQRYLGQAWAEYTRRRPTSGYRYSTVLEHSEAGLEALGGEILPVAQQAMKVQRPVVGKSNGRAMRLGEETSSSALVVPIVLRGQPIGALGFEATETDRQWKADDVTLAESIAEQFALAVDNLRLLEETQRRVARERLTSEITARMRETLNVETVLKTAAQEVRQALGLPEVIVRLIPQSSEQARDHMSGDT
jgi:GAF domain-containing protein